MGYEFSIHDMVYNSTISNQCGQSYVTWTNYIFKLRQELCLLVGLHAKPPKSILWPLIDELVEYDREPIEIVFDGRSCVVISRSLVIGNRWCSYKSRYLKLQTILMESMDAACILLKHNMWRNIVTEDSQWMLTMCQGIIPSGED